MLILTPIVVVLLLTTALNFLGTYLTWRRVKRQSSRYYAWAASAVTVWTLMSALDYAAVPLSLKILFAKLEYASFLPALALFALGALAFSGTATPLQQKRIAWFYALLVGSNLLLVWTNDWTGWMWSAYTDYDRTLNTVVFEPGPLYLWVMVSGYVMLFGLLVPLGYASFAGAGLLRRQARLLLLFSVLQLLTNLVYQLQPHTLRGIDWSPLLFSLTNLGYLWALYGARLFDLHPIARDHIVNTLQDGVIVLDERGAIVELNQPAARLIQPPSTPVVGQALQQVLPALAPLLHTSSTAEARMELTLATQVYEVSLTPLREQNHVIGRLILLHDITARQTWLQMLQATFDSMPTGIVVVDDAGDIVLTNQRATQIFQLGESEAQPTSTKPGVRRRLVETIAPYMQNVDAVLDFQRQSHRELRLNLKDGRVFDVRVSACRVDELLIGDVWTFEDVTQRLYVEKAEIVQAERQRIAQEAHDGVLQGLVGFRLQLPKWRRRLTAQPAQGQTLIDETYSLTTETIEEMHRLIFALRPISLAGDLWSALRQLAERMQQTYRLSIDLDLCGEDHALPLAWEQPLLRVVQEALANSVKHGTATQVWVRLVFAPPHPLQLTIRDNGRGFDVTTYVPGYGLTNIRERIQRLHGEVSIQSAPHHGTVINITVPSDGL